MDPYYVFVVGFFVGVLFSVLFLAVLMWEKECGRKRGNGGY